MPGQSFVNLQELEISRPQRGTTSTEIVNVTSNLSSFDFREYSVDAVSGTVSSVFTIPAGTVVDYATYVSTGDHVGGTTIEVGTGVDPDGFLSVTTPLEDAITVSTGALLNTGFEVDTDVNITVTGVYTSGTGVVKLRLFNPYATMNDRTTNVVAVIPERNGYVGG